MKEIVELLERETGDDGRTNRLFSDDPLSLCANIWVIPDVFTILITRP
jgi:hypothetical protein